MENSMIESSTNDDVTSKESDNNVRLVSLKSENNLKSTLTSKYNYFGQRNPKVKIT